MPAKAAVSASPGMRCCRARRPAGGSTDRPPAESCASKAPTGLIIRIIRRDGTVFRRCVACQAPAQVADPAPGASAGSRARARHARREPKRPCVRSYRGHMSAADRPMCPPTMRPSDHCRPGQFLLTGSAQVLALRELPDALPGRMEIIELWPFSQGELEQSSDAFIDAAFARGPGLSRTSPLRKRDYLVSWFGDG